MTSSMKLESVSVVIIKITYMLSLLLLLCELLGGNCLSSMCQLTWPLDSTHLHVIFTSVRYLNLSALRGSEVYLLV